MSAEEDSTRKSREWLTGIASFLRFVKPDLGKRHPSSNIWTHGLLGKNLHRVLELVHHFFATGKPPEADLATMDHRDFKYDSLSAYRPTRFSDDTGAFNPTQTLTDPQQQWIDPLRAMSRALSTLGRVFGGGEAPANANSAEFDVATFLNPRDVTSSERTAQGQTSLSIGAMMLRMSLLRYTNCSAMILGAYANYKRPVEPLPWHLMAALGDAFAILNVLRHIELSENGMQHRIASLIIENMERAMQTSGSFHAGFLIHNVHLTSLLLMGTRRGYVEINRRNGVDPLDYWPNLQRHWKKKNAAGEYPMNNVVWFTPATRHALAFIYTLLCEPTVAPAEDRQALDREMAKTSSSSDRGRVVTFQKYLNTWVGAHPINIDWTGLHAALSSLQRQLGQTLFTEKDLT